ncbi:MAG: 3D domain-containing protein [Clostridiaceae bacterium]
MKKVFSRSIFIALFAAVTIFTVVFAVNSMKKHITIVIDGKEQVVETYKETVSEVLSENGISIAAKDKIDRENSEILNKEDKIEIITAVPVEVTADGAVHSFMTAEKTVKDLLETENIALNEVDKLSANLLDPIENGMKISIIRVTSEIVYEAQPIDFAVQENKDSSLLKGKTQVKQEGSAGERKITKERTYEDGVLVSEVEVSNEVVTAPVDKVIAIGTKVPEPVVVVAKAAPATVVSRGGSTPSGLSYSSSMRVTATAYAGDGITATGTVPVRNASGWSTIAVDRNVIPMGTRVYVENYGYAIAEDVGGAIKGNIIDVFMNSESEANAWGRRTVTIYILN